MYAAKGSEKEGTNRARKQSKCEEIRDRMKASVKFVMKFDINDRVYANVDEATFTEALKQFRNGVKSAERYSKLYQMLLGHSTPLKFCE